MKIGVNEVVTLEFFSDKFNSVFLGYLIVPETFPNN